LHKEGKYETNYTKYKINLIGFPFKVKSIEIDNEEVSFDSMKLEEANYFIVEKNLTFYISLENKKKNKMLKHLILIYK
jgi:alpha-glucosidase